MGAFGPYSEVILFKNTLFAQILVPFELGTKVELYKKKVTSILRKDLLNIWGNWWEDPTLENMEMGENLWYTVGNKTLSFGKLEFKLPEKLSIRGISKKKKLIGLKNLHYFGNFSGEALCLLSTLMEIKDLRPYK